VERAFLTIKASRLRIRPVHVHSEDRVRAHVFPCMLAYHVEWHMRRRPAPLLSGDDDRGAARGQRAPPVEPAMVPERARARADAGRAADGLPVHSLTTPLAGPGTLTPRVRAAEGRPRRGCCHVSDRFRTPESASGPLKRGGFLCETRMKFRLNSGDSRREAIMDIPYGVTTHHYHLTTKGCAADDPTPPPQDLLILTTATPADGIPITDSGTLDPDELPVGLP